MISSIDDIRKRCKTVFEKSPAQKAIVFGSWANGTQSRHSDIDIIIIEKTTRRFFERYKDFDGLYDALKEQGLDLLVYTPEELEEIGHRHFIRNALSKGTVIYER